MGHSQSDPIGPLVACVQLRTESSFVEQVLWFYNQGGKMYSIPYTKVTEASQGASYEPRSLSICWELPWTSNGTLKFVREASAITLISPASYYSQCQKYSTHGRPYKLICSTF